MRGLRRNKTTLYYALYQGKQKVYDHNGLFTGDYEETYSEPVKARMNVAPAQGDADWNPFGISTPYHKAVMTFDLNCPISETSKVWIDKSIDEPANYVVVALAKSLNVIVYALREVKATAHESSSQG